MWVDLMKPSVNSQRNGYFREEGFEALSTIAVQGLCGAILLALQASAVTCVNVCAYGIVSSPVTPQE